MGNDNEVPGTSEDANWTKIWDDYVKENPTQAAKIKVPLPGEVIKDDNFRDNFLLFKRKFTHYARLTAMMKLPNVIQVEQLLALIGDACNRILDNLDLEEGDRNTVDKIFDVLERAITATDNPNEWQLKLLDARQQTGESILDFVDRLRDLAKKSDLTRPVKDKMLMMKLMHGLSCEKLRAKLVKGRHDDFEQMIRECTAQKAAEESNMSGMNASIMAFNRFPMRRGAFSSRGGFSRGQGQSFRGNFRGNSSNTRTFGGQSRLNCPTCGGNHFNRTCPALNRKCDLCGEVGHYRRVCRKVNEVQPMLSDSVIDFGGENSAQANVEQPSDLTVVEQYDPVEFLFPVTEMNRVSGSKATTNVDVRTGAGGWQSMEVLVDTGAGVSVIDRRMMLVQGYNPSSVSGTPIPLKGFGNGIQMTLGTMMMPVRFAGVIKEVKFHVVDTIPRPILGFDDVVALHLVQVMFNININPELNKIIESYNDVFTGLGKLPGFARIIVERPPLGYTTRQVPRRVPVNLRDELKKQLDLMVEQDVICKQEDPTEWCHNLVLVKRADKLRICLDPIPMNRFIKREEFQIPKLDEVLPNLSRAKVFTTCDAKSGFWQLVLDEKSSLLTTFWTPFGRYRWKRMPFGVCNAPEVFQRAMCEFAADLQQVVPLADDFLIYGVGNTVIEAKADHDLRLCAFLNKCRSIGLRLNRDKLQYCRSEVKFFGHILTSDGLKVDSTKTNAIIKMDAPTDCRGVARYLGMVNYLAKYVNNLSSISEPLRRLVNAKEFVWGPDQQAAFEKLKTVLVSPPILQYYDPAKHPVIQCDASSVGLGAVLLQDGRVVEYASKALTKTEQNYAQIEKETLAILFSLRKFDHLVVGRQVTVETDHKPLINIANKPLCEAPKRIQRMFLALQRYDIRLIHKAGKEMYVADTLSRATVDDGENLEVYWMDMDFSLEEIEQINSLDYIPISDGRIEELKLATSKDQVLQLLRKFVIDGFPYDYKDIPVDVRPFWNFKDQLSYQHGLIFKGDKIVVPAILRDDVLKQLHSAHQGIERTLALARDTVFWPNIDSQIESVVRSCLVCQKYSASNRRLPMMSHDVPVFAYQKVSIDLFEWNKQNFLILTCHFSDWWEIYKMSNITASLVIAKCKDNFAKYGIPQEVTNDGGGQFNSAAYNNFAKSWNFSWTASTPEHQEANGKAESAVKAAKKLLQKAYDSKEDFEKLLLQWRNIPDETGFSPAQRLMARRTRNFVPMLGDKLMHNHNLASVPEKIMQQRLQSKKYYDRGTREVRDLVCGELVFVRLKRNDKFWTEGVVAAVISSRVYDVNVNGRIFRRDRFYLKPRIVPDSEKPMVKADVFDPVEASLVPGPTILPSLSKPAVVPDYQTVYVQHTQTNSKADLVALQRGISAQTDPAGRSLTPLESSSLPFRHIQPDGRVRRISQGFENLIADCVFDTAVDLEQTAPRNRFENRIASCVLDVTADLETSVREKCMSSTRQNMTISQDLMEFCADVSESESTIVEEGKNADEEVILIDNSVVKKISSVPMTTQSKYKLRPRK